MIEARDVDTIYQVSIAYHDQGFDAEVCKYFRLDVGTEPNFDRSMLLVTHYERLLELIVPDRVHVLVAGRIVRSGTRELARELDERGFDWLQAGAPA